MYYLTTIKFPDDDVYTLFIYDKLLNSGDVLSSDAYYVAGFDKNNTKIILELRFSDDLLKTEVNKTNVYHCYHGTTTYCKYIDTLK